MDKTQLINIACRWLDFHNSDAKYITTRSDGSQFINGGLQTDLRFYLNSVMDDDYWIVSANLQKENNK